MSTIRVGFYFLVGCLLTALALESTLRVLPVSRGLFRTIDAEKWPLKAFAPHVRYTYSMTWDFQNSQSGRTNNYGHLAPFDFERDSKPVIVLGDSFIEAQMLNYDATLQGQLSRRMGAKIPVYGMGFSGNSTAEYLAVAALAKDEFRPRGAVILMIDGDISEASSAAPLHYYFDIRTGAPAILYQPSQIPSIMRRIRESIGDSALLRYVFSNLRFSISNLRGWQNATSSSDIDKNAAAVDLRKEQSIVDFFLAQFSIRSGIPAQCTVFLFDSDRFNLYEPESKTVTKVDPPALTQYFVSRARSMGYHVVDLEQQFASHYRNHRQKFDFWPIDKHWNWLGHKLAAEAAHAALSGSSGCI